ncbi:hypothetical protein EYF80_036310 [Liparis tanakae]|uniref:Uncharacterized protein n=1 Tax=Liparis tanakae TaxID=230148 RepID=A0A4Z2GIV2_9TELE|nr:hypothetical protein EYF80_036310 [Liparis tanakae]
MYLIAADGEQDVLFRDLEARGEHGFEVSLVPVLPETGHLAGAGHLHPEDHVGSGQARERKLGDLEDKGTHDSCQTGQSLLKDSHLGDQLQVERSRDLQLLANGVDDHLDPLHRLLVEILRRRHQRGVAGVNAGVLHVFGHGDGHHDAVAGDRVYVYLLDIVGTTQSLKT